MLPGINHIPANNSVLGTLSYNGLIPSMSMVCTGPVTICTLAIKRLSTGKWYRNSKGPLPGQYKPIRKKHSGFVVALYWLPLDGQYNACTGTLENHKGFVLAT